MIISKAVPREKVELELYFFCLSLFQLLYLNLNYFFRFLYKIERSYEFFSNIIIMYILFLTILPNMTFY